MDSNTLINRAGDFRGPMKKYWAQRYDIFAKYDSGVLLTKELWYSVTPETISKFTAKFLNKAFEGGEGPVRVMDAFCGGGGNVIQFLDYSDEVFAVDINKIHLHCTYNNATLYLDRGVLNEKLVLLPLDWTVVDKKGENGEVYVDGTSPSSSQRGQLEDAGSDSDCSSSSEASSEDLDLEAQDETYATLQDSLHALERLENSPFDCIFGSPPWGGPDYIQQKLFDLDNLLPFTLDKLLRVFLRYTNEIALFLPKNSDLDQLKRVTDDVFGPGSVVRVLKMSSQGRPKGLLVCWGPRFEKVALSDIVL